MKPVRKQAAIKILEGIKPTKVKKRKIKKQPIKTSTELAEQMEGGVGNEGAV